MKKGILMTLFGAFVFIYHLVLTCQSFYAYTDYAYDDEGNIIPDIIYGRGYEIDQDLMVKTFVGLVLLICGIVALVKYIKKQDTFKTYNTSIIVVGTLMSIYPLGLMFKMINKLASTSNPDKIAGYKGDIVDYLIWAIFGAFILAYGIISYIEHKKKNA